MHIVVFLNLLYIHVKITISRKYDGASRPFRKSSVGSNREKTQRSRPTTVSIYSWWSVARWCTATATTVKPCKDEISRSSVRNPYTRLRRVLNVPLLLTALSVGMPYLFSLTLKNSWKWTNKIIYIFDTGVPLALADLWDHFDYSVSRVLIPTEQYQK